MWLDGVVFFSNPFVKLSLNLVGDNTFVVSGEQELIRFIDEYKPPKRLSEEDVDDIVEQLDRIM